MTRSNRDRIGGMLGVVGAVFVLTAALACSTAQTPAQAPGQGSGTLTDVRVERMGGSTVVTLLGVQEPKFSSNELSGPRRLVLELDGVQPERLERRGVYDGGVDEMVISPLTAADGTASTRVEVGLAPSAEYRVVPRHDRIEIRVRQLTPQSSAAAPVESAPPAVSAGPEDAAAAPAAPASQETAPAPAGNGVASKLLGIEAQQAADGTTLTLRGDGRIESVETFVLEHPSRLVIDISGVKNAVTQSRVDVGTAQVSRVRVAQHDGKVRVVIDGGSAAAPFDGRRITPSGDGLVIALGSSEGTVQTAQSEPTAAASPAPEPAASATTAPPAAADPAPAAAAAQPAAGNRLVGVKLDPQADRTRVVIENDSEAKYQLMRPDKDTVIVRLRNSALAEGATDLKIVPEQPGPVSLVTAFAQPKVKTPEVRVVIKRASGATPQVTREGNSILLDFAPSSTAAAKPPMLTAPAEGEAAPAAVADEPTGQASRKAVAQASAPAAMESGGAADILQEGGLVNGKEYNGRRISLDLKDVDINDVLRLIAEVSDLNVIAGDEVQGKVTIRLVDVPWDQALDVILLTRGLGFVRVGTVLRIAPTDQLKQEEEARLQERRAKEKLEDLAVKLQPVNYATVDEVEKMVKRLLTPRGVVNVDKRTSTIIIKDIPSVIDEATALIKAIDTQTPQVLIEAKIVEANLDFAREVGTVWSLGSQPFVDGFDSASGPRTDLGGQDFRLHDSNNIIAANPITSVATGLANVGAFLLDDKMNVNLQIQAAESNGEGKVISSPRVVTLDNREAKIEQGVSIPFQTFENGDAQLEFIDAVLSLLVTPHITADKSIIMKVEVTRNAPDDSVQTPTGSPAIAKNQAKTETLVKDGQTLVIGGIYTINKSERQSRVPYLWKVPILGNAFKSNEIRDVRKELLIFLTPRVVESAEVAG